MDKRVTVKSERDEYRLFRSRARVAAGIVFVALVLVFVRLIYLQVTSYGYYTQLSKENYQKRIPIPPVRGLIYDRNGVLLADNHIEYVLEAKHCWCLRYLIRCISWHIVIKVLHQRHGLLSGWRTLR